MYSVLLRIARQRRGPEEGAVLTNEQSTNLVPSHCGPGVHDLHVPHQHYDAVMGLLAMYSIHSTTNFTFRSVGRPQVLKPKLRAGNGVGDAIQSFDLQSLSIFLKLHSESTRLANFWKWSDQEISSFLLCV